MKPVILTVAGTGGKWNRQDSPWLPMTPEEIVNDTIASFKAGASMAHIHARDDKGIPSHDPSFFRRIIEPIRAQCKGIIIQISTGYMEGQIRAKMEPLLKLRPDLASFNLKGNFEDILLTAYLMKEYGVKPVVECFSMDMLSDSVKLIERGVLEEPVFYEFVFPLEDNGHSFRELAQELLLREGNILSGSQWSQTRGGRHQRGLQSLSLLLGGHIRAGLEDNLYLQPGIQAKKSSELINQAIKFADMLGRKIATPEEGREILGLSD